MSPLSMTGLSGAVSTLTGGITVASGSPQFNWRYYAYGSTIGTTRIYWGLASPTSTKYLLRTVSGQQHTGTGQTWNTYSEDLSAYSGTTGYIYIVYTPGSNFYNDPQFDNMELVDTTGGTIDLDPGTSTGRGRWYRYNGSYTTNTTPPTSWTTIPIGTSATNRWNYDAGGTPSSSTGNTVDANGSSSGYYLYFEGSSPNYGTGGYYWVRTASSYTLL